MTEFVEPQTEEHGDVLTNGPQAVTAAQQEEDRAKSMPTPADVPLPTTSSTSMTHASTVVSGKQISPGNQGADENITVAPTAIGQGHQLSTTSTRGRGRGGMRGRGKRTSLSSTKVKKRKRSGSNGEDEDATGSSSDEVCTPTAVTTKSGRSVQRPTAYVPPATASPNGATNGSIRIEAGTNGATARVYKKKRVWRRNAENAVCKACLRGTSPASNMIVFCDGCNTPYHRWCHHPPINQNVIDEPDKEWYCRACGRERVVPVPEGEIAHWTAAPGAAHDERRQFFMSLTPGTMVTLLMRATTLQPSLPVFAPEWASKHGHSTALVADTPSAVSQPSQPPTAAASFRQQATGQQPATIYVQHDDDDDEDEGYGAEEHPPHYVRPGKGLMSTLPPDKDDDKYLVDEEGSRGVFHHVYLVDENTTTPIVNTDQA